MALIQIQTVRDAQGIASFQIPSDTPLHSQQSSAGSYQSTGIGNQGGVHRVTVSNGIATSDYSTVERYNPREQASSLPTSGNNALLLAGRTRGGQPLNSEADIRDDTFFTVNGVHFPATSAAKAGLLVKNADGSYSVPGGSQHAPNAAMDATGAPQPKQAPQESPTAEFFDADTSMVVADFNALTGSQSTTESVAAQALLPYLEGNTERAAQILSGLTGGEPSDSLQRIDQLFHKVHASASAYMTKNFGVPGDEVFAYLSENLPAAQRASLSHRIFLGDKSAFLDAREHYLKGMRREQHEQQQLKNR